MKICLGTVQFGLDYGITNQGGKADLNTCKLILENATKQGLSHLDTAAAYGESESVLGKLAAAKSFQLITKLPPNTSLEDLTPAIAHSFSLTQASSFYGLLCHRIEDLLNMETTALSQQITTLKDAGKIQKFGVSLYDPTELEKALDHAPYIDLIQVPCNVFDQRFLVPRIQQLIKDNHIEVHARSLFLQGSLLASKTPAALITHAENFSRWRDFCQHHNISLLEGCLAFAQQQNLIDQWVIGVTNSQELEDIFLSQNKLSEMALPALNFASLQQTALSLINPSLWR